MYPSDSEVESLITEHEFTWTSTRRDGTVKTYTDTGHDAWRNFADGTGSVQVASLGSVELIDQEGGGEGGGEYAHNIYRVIFPNNEVKLYKKEGAYFSYDGLEWDGDFGETRVVEKTILVYE